MDHFGYFNSGFMVIPLVVVIIAIFPYVRIIQKAGYSGWWILIALVPGVNFIMLWVFALSDWPALRDQDQH